jgi:superfamily II DNA or RNA helicase
MLTPVDSQGGHDLVKLMGDPIIPEYRKHLAKDGYMIENQDIFNLRTLFRKYRPDFETDKAFDEFAKKINTGRDQKPKEPEPILLEAYVVYTRITGDNIPVEDIKKVTRFFLKAAVNVPAYKEGKWDGYFNLYDLRRRAFPTGLLERVCKVLDKKKLKYQIVWQYDQFPEKQFDWKANFNGVTPDEDQWEAINAAVAKRRGIVKAPTGWGKTAVFAEGVIAALGLPTLFVANKKQLLDDAAEDFTKGIDGATCLPIKDGVFGSVKMTKNTLSEDVQNALSAPILTATIQSLDARLKDDRTGPVLRDWLQKTCKLVIVDESQAVGTTTWDEVLDEVRAPCRIFLSATPRRTDGATIKLEAGSGPWIFSTTADEQIKKGRLCELDITYNVFDHGLFNEDDSNIIYAEAYRACILENEKRNRQVVVDPAIQMVNEGRHVLILIQYIDHGHILKNMLMEAGIEPQNIRFIWGETPDKIRKSAIAEFRKGDFQVMIGSTIFDAGVNIPVISGVILAGAGNSDITLIQRIGRGARNCDYEDVLGYLPEFMQEAEGQKKKTKIFDVMDANIKFFGRQARNRYNNACDEFGKDRVHIAGSAERPPTKLSKDFVDEFQVQAAKMRMMLGMED